MLFLYNYWKEKNQKTHLGTKNQRAKLFTQMHYINFPFLHVFYMAADYFHSKYGKEACSTLVRYEIFIALKHSWAEMEESNDWVDSLMKIQEEWDYSNYWLILKQLPDVC